MRTRSAGWLVAIMFLVAGVTQIQAYTYNDNANGAWTNPATWSSSDGGSTFPQAGDTATIASHLVDVSITNPAGTIYVNAGGVMRVGSNSVGGCTSVNAALHLNGGTLNMWGRYGAVYWYNPTQVVTVAVDSDSYITNSYSSGSAYFGYNYATNARFTGTGNLTVYEPLNSYGYLYLTTNDTTYAGSWRILKGAWCFPDLATRTQGAFAAAIAGLSPGTVYWYRCLATNAYGTAWADSATNFTTLVPHTYNDKTNGLWSDTNTWFSSDGGTSFPQQVCDTAIIDSHTVDVTIPNPVGTIYLRTGGVMRVGNNSGGGCTNAQAALHLAGGALDMWAGSGHGCNWYNSSTNLDLVVDANS